jgi:hypothetical protein
VYYEGKDSSVVSRGVPCVSGAVFAENHRTLSLSVGYKLFYFYF